MRSRTLLAAIVALLVSAAGCGDDDEDTQAPAAAKPNGRASIASFKFLPKTIELKVGGTITWTNRDKAPHTATSDERAAARFDTGRLTTGESGKARLEKPGSYPYFCRFHPFMTGTIEVRE